MLSLGAFAVAGRMSVGALGVAPVLAATLALVEGLSGGGVDNVVLPAVAAGLLSLAM